MKNKILFLLAGFILIFLACQNDKILNDPSARLKFSVDTVSFDTIFSTIGSTTHQLVVYNDYSNPVKISSIKLADNTKNFRLNINGFQGNSLQDVKIPSKDSIFIFIEVTVDPTNKRNPMIIQDSIEFITNGNLQDVDLIAYGQDVHLIDTLAIRKDTTWNDDKPYLIKNYVFVDENAKLTITKGTRLHFERDAGLYVVGTLEVLGTIDSLVTFQGPRLEHMYRDVPGQWDRIAFGAGSNDNFINYAVIKNAVMGVNMGTFEGQRNTSLQLANTRIEHHTYAGIFANDSKITATNCIIGDCGYYSLACLGGGEYLFFHSTIANHWVWTSRSEPAVLLVNALPEGVEGGIPGDMDAYFGNCILTGNRSNELQFGINSDYAFNFLFESSILQIDTEEFQVDTTMEGFEEIVWAADTSSIFINPYREDNYNYQLDTIYSIAKDQGDINIVNLLPGLLNNDIQGNSRTSDKAPDIGAYEQTKNPE